MVQICDLEPSWFNKEPFLALQISITFLRGSKKSSFLYGSKKLKSQKKVFFFFFFFWPKMALNYVFGTILGLY